MELLTGLDLKSCQLNTLAEFNYAQPLCYGGHKDHSWPPAQIELLDVETIGLLVALAAPCASKPKFGKFI
jgi:hypothetical protein